MMYILAYAPSGKEFATADAINALGALAVVPRKVEETRNKERKHVIIESPALPNYMFLSISERIWHKIMAGMLVKGKTTHIHTVAEIGSKEWERVQNFLAEVEMDYQYRMALIEDREWQSRHPGPPPSERPYIAPYNVEEKLHLLGGDLEARFIQSLGTQAAPMIEVEVTMFGRPVKAKVEPDKVKRWAAE